ncbi:putative ankyrin repeat protein RF_0381 [Phymastichus coffea]|uniref:putative ankyrin repeat protein RF_0381 n=1 Tax=Phymastichus coffea TaxID=108790 RepID=UPI00273C52DB|nr:putative ankyrin repeat protein RF_0381 [Phymastichus coffea]
MIDEVSYTMECGTSSELKELLNKNIDVNVQDEYGQTILHKTANQYQPQSEAVKHLLITGADILKIDKYGYTALHLALKNRSKDHAFVRVILENIKRDEIKKLLNMKTEFLTVSGNTGNTALHIATVYNFYVDITTLLEYGADYEIQNYAGEKPIHVANSEGIRQLFQMIDNIFIKAKNGDEQLTQDLAKLNTVEFLSVMNCRNNDGHTLTQVLVFNSHHAMMPDLLEHRFSHPTNTLRVLDDQALMKKFHTLVEMVRNARNFWHSNQSIVASSFHRVIDKSMEAKRRLIHYESFQIGLPEQLWNSAKISCKMLQVSHEALLSYRYLNGKDKPLTDSAMRNVEEVFELLGYNRDQLINKAEINDWYYHNLPEKYKTCIECLYSLIFHCLDAAFYYFLRTIESMFLCDAVRNNNIETVMSQLDFGASVECYDTDYRSALYYAVANGNKNMIRLIMDSGKTRDYNGETTALFLAINIGDPEIVHEVLMKIDSKSIVRFIDRRGEHGRTFLHTAAKNGNLEIVKILLTYGATYMIFDDNCQIPLEVSTNNDVCMFLRLVDQYFQEAKQLNNEFIYGLASRTNDEVMAIICAKNQEGDNLAAEVAKIGDMNLANFIAKMWRDVTKRSWV